MKDFLHGLLNERGEMLGPRFVLLDLALDEVDLATQLGCAFVHLFLQEKRK